MRATATSARRRSDLKAAPALLGAALALAGLSACLGRVDPDRARICRVALPALEPAGTVIAVTGLRAAPDGVRVDYEAGPAGGPGASRFAACRFSAPGLGRGRADLVGVTTDRGEIAGATVFLLRRFYVETPDGIAGEPPDAAPGLPEWPKPLLVGAEHLLVGLPRTAVYGLLASAYSLVFGLVGRINLAFGEIAAVGAATVGLLAAAGVGGPLPFPLALALGLGLAAASAALHDAVLGRIAFGAVPAGSGQASLVATVGLSLALGEYLRLAGPAVPDWVPPLGGEPLPLARAGPLVLALSPVGLAVTGTGLLAAAGALALVRGSAFGRRWRALADDPLAAALCGVDPRRTLLETLALAGALAGLAGGLVALQWGALGFAGGFTLGLKALAAAVVGGVGSVPGALAGGLLIGLFETLWSALMPIEGRDLALSAALVAAVVLRPRGLFARPGPAGRDLR